MDDLKFYLANNNNDVVVNTLDEICEKCKDNDNEYLCQLNENNNKNLPASKQGLFIYFVWIVEFCWNNFGRFIW